MFLAARWNSILIILCVLASCTPAIKSEPDALRDLTLPTEPQKGLFAKLRQQYPSDRYLIGIGQADSEKAATELARADLMKQIRVEVRVTWTDLIRERGANTEQEVSRLVETEVAELVKGIEIVDQGTDTKTGTAYAVAVLPKADAGRAWTPAQARAIKSSAGAQLSSDVVAGFFAPLTLSAGAAWGHDGSAALAEGVILDGQADAGCDQQQRTQRPCDREAES